MRSQLLISLAFIGMLSLASCTSTEPLVVPPVIDATPTMAPTSPVVTEDESVDMDILDKPLPELDEIEALLAEYSGTDVK